MANDKTPSVPQFQFQFSVFNFSSQFQFQFQFQFLISISISVFNFSFQIPKIHPVLAEALSRSHALHLVMGHATRKTGVVCLAPSEQSGATWDNDARDADELA